MKYLKSHLLCIGGFTALLLSGYCASAQFFTREDPRFILAIQENIKWDRQADELNHDHLSFTFSIVNHKNNHHELSINNLSSGDNKFFLGLGYQYKWQWFKKLLVHPYLGIYNDINYRSENVIDSEDFPKHEVAWKGGIAPGLTAHIGRIHLDGSFRVPLYQGVFQRESDPTSPEGHTKTWDMDVGAFKDYFAIRFGVGYRF